MALILGARGGVYLSGDLIDMIGPLFNVEAFSGALRRQRPAQRLRRRDTGFSRRRRRISRLSAWRRFSIRAGCVLMESKPRSSFCFVAQFIRKVVTTLSDCALIFGEHYADHILLCDFAIGAFGQDGPGHTGSAAAGVDLL
ncbi:MAG: hypothetical protein WDN06_21810 [Asticcacaulis sp.]